MARPPRRSSALLALLALIPLGCGATASVPREVAVEVGYVALDPKSESPVLVLFLSIIEWLGLSRDVATLVVDRALAGSPAAVDRTKLSLPPMARTIAPPPCPSASRTAPTAS